VLVGAIANSVIVWRHLRSRGDSSRLALGALIAGTVGVFAIAASVLIAFLGIGFSDDDIETRALGDCRNISTAILLFQKDTSVWPIYASADHGPESRVDYLYGNMGEMPDFKEGEVRESWGNHAEDAYFLLVTNGRGSPWYEAGRRFTAEEEFLHERYGKPIPPDIGWRGPYLPYVTDDPWGYAFLASVSGFDEVGTKPDNRAWCLSAGPNGIVDTPAWATETRGDDVGYQVVR